jgi:hypothetical protein
MTIEAPKSKENLIVSLTGGQSALVVPKPSTAEKPPDVELQAHGPSTGAVIYTDETEMPSLEQLLKENRIAYAVLERESTHVSYVRVVAGAGIGVGTSVAGWVLFLQSVAGSTVRANPYTALSLALGGIVLIATLLVALYGPPRGHRGH